MGAESAAIVCGVALRREGRDVAAQRRGRDSLSSRRGRRAAPVTPISKQPDSTAGIVLVEIAIDWCISKTA